MYILGLSKMIFTHYENKTGRVDARHLTYGLLKLYLESLLPFKKLFLTSKHARIMQVSI